MERYGLERISYGRNGWLICKKRVCLGHGQQWRYLCGRRLYTGWWGRCQPDSPLEWDHLEFVGYGYHQRGKFDGQCVSRCRKWRGIRRRVFHPGRWNCRQRRSQVEWRGLECTGHGCRQRREWWCSACPGGSQHWRAVRGRGLQSGRRSGCQPYSPVGWHGLDGPRGGRSQRRERRQRFGAGSRWEWEGVRGGQLYAGRSRRRKWRC